VREEEGTADRIKAAVEYDPLWLENDVVVPLASALYPIGQPWEEYKDGEEIKPGVWHVMPVKYGVDHGYYCGWDPNNRDFEELVGFYVKHIKLLEETCGARETAAA
jgi:hypothetical protein